MLPMAAIGAYLNRQPNVVYAPYRAAAHSLGISAITDQNTAGAIMWVIGNTLMVLVGLGAVMAALVADERRQRARDAHLPAAAGPGVTRGRVEP
jgi:cytochrome c oxidase assembly factor CtaG